MAIHTAASVVLLGGAILLAQPEEGMPALLMSPLTGSQMARSLFPACLLLPVFLGMVIGRVERAGGLAPEFSDALLTMILIACLGTLVVVVAQALNRADTQRREALDRQTTLMHELDHRVKNNLAAVVALAEQTISASASLDSFRSAYFGRLRAMARAHEALARSRWSGINIADIVRLIVAPYVTAPARLQITGDDVVLPARASSSLSMTLHELTTNAVKHGALRGAGGLVEIRWSSLDDDSLLLVWRESGGPPVSQAGGSGFGLGLIRAVIPHELGGSVDLEFLQGGVSCSMRLPLFDQDPAENAVTVAAS